MICWKTKSCDVGHTSRRGMFCPTGMIACCLRLRHLSLGSDKSEASRCPKHLFLDRPLNRSSHHINMSTSKPLAAVSRSIVRSARRTNPRTRFISSNARLSSQAAAPNPISEVEPINPPSSNPPLSFPCLDNIETKTRNSQASDPSLAPSPHIPPARIRSSTAQSPYCLTGAESCLLLTSPTRLGVL
jgi:hypothetical protein